MKKLQFIKSKLKEWNKVTFGDLEKKKNIFTDIVNIDVSDQQGNLTTKQLVLRALRKGEFKELLFKEQVCWRQNLRFNGPKKIIVILKFFHRVANGMRNRKFIKSFMFEKGEILDDIENTFEEIVHFFGKLCSKPLRVS